MRTPVDVPVREQLDWATFGQAAREVATAVLESGWHPEVVVSVARGGLFTAGALCYALGVKNVHVLNVEFYTGVDARLPEPVLLPPRPDAAEMTGRRVLVADDVADTGATLALARDLLTGHGADVRLAVLYEKPRSSEWCHYSWRTTDRWVEFPWAPLEPVTF